MTQARKAVAVTTLAVALFAAVVVQLTVVNRLPLPGASTPDLVLLLVTAIAVATSPALAAVTGFAGGLALDVAPPAAHYAGEYALVFCLAGYAAARVNRALSDATGERAPLTAFTVMAVATAAGEAGKAALGLLLSDPDVTTAAVSRVLPGAVLYDLLLAPLAFWVVARLTRAAAAERAPAPEFSRAQRPASVFREAGFRQASAGAAPRLHLAGSGASHAPQSPARRLPRLQLAGTGANYKSHPVPGRVPKLRLSAASPGPVSRTVAPDSGTSQFPLVAGRAKKLNFAGDLRLGTRARALRSPGKNWLRSAPASALGTARRPARGPDRGWLSGGRRASTPAVKRTPRNGWLRRSRHPWRRRGRQILRRIGVSK